MKRFKSKYCLTNRRVHYHRRPIANPETMQRCKEFYKKITALYKEHKEANTLQYLINIDETAWKICNFGDMTWARKGSEHIEFTSDFNEKDMITAIAAITASKECFKLPLCLIKKGKTQRTIRKSGLNKYFQMEVSENGWSTVKCFAHYLYWFRKELNERYSNIPGYSNDQEIDIILDLYASHRNTNIQEIAKKTSFSITLHTCRIYRLISAIRSICLWCIEKYGEICILQRHTLEHACKILLDCWADLSEETMHKAWGPYSNPDQADVDSLINRASITLEFENDPLTIDENVETRPLISIRPEEMDSDDESDEDDDLEMIRGEEIDEYIINQMKEVIAYENIQLAQSNAKSIVKPITNIWGTCNANTTTQTVSIIPAFREHLNIWKNTGMLERDPILKAIDECISVYDSKKDIVCEIPTETCFGLAYDTCDNINHIPQVMNYGLRAEDGTIISTINILPKEDETIDQAQIIDEIIGKCPYSFNKAIAFRKEPTLCHEFPDIFSFGRYLFILKAIVCNETESHFYLFIRERFIKDFYEK